MHSLNSTRRLLRFAALISLVAVTLAPSASSAQETDAEYAEARVVFEEAATQFQSENYALALQGFERSYAMMEGHPGQALILFNVGRCQEELGRTRDARDAYRRYLREAEDGAVHRSQVETRLRELETRLGMSGEEGAIPEPEHVDDAASPEALPEPAEETDSSGGDGLVLAGAVTLGVGGVGLGIFAVAGGLALSERAALEDGCGMRAACTDDEVSTQRSLNTVADIGLIVGAAALAAGAVMLVLGLMQSDSESDVAFAPYFDSNGGGLATMGSF